MKKQNHRVAEQYARANPLGGPAKVFDAMAAAIRAGDDYEAVLRTFGFATIESVKAPTKEWVSLTEPEILDGFCSAPHQVQYVSVFKQGALWAQQQLMEKNQ
jgi:hypothetical protein